MINFPLSDDEFLDKFSRIAFRHLDAVDDDPFRLEEPYKTFIFVYNAQGVIDNGGLRYFFENDWPDNWAYSEFADSYMRIGREDLANILRTAAASFGIDQPESDCDARRAYMEEHFDADKHEITGFDDSICGDKQVWSDLVKWTRPQVNMDD